MGSSNMQFYDIVLGKLIGDYFVPVVLYNEDLTLAIMREIHDRTLGEHLAEKKLLEKSRKDSTGRRKLMIASRLVGNMLYIKSNAVVL